MKSDKEFVKTCVGNVQNGLYELTEEEAEILSNLESIVYPKTFSSSSSDEDRTEEGEGEEYATSE